MEGNLAKIRVLESEIVQRETAVQMRMKYLKYLQNQTSINIEVQGLKQDEHLKAGRAGE